MIAKVEDHQIKLGKQMLPVWKVSVGREAIAMRKNQTHSICAAMAPHENFCAILQYNVKHHAGSGQFVAHGSLPNCKSALYRAKRIQMKAKTIFQITTKSVYDR
jgi:hypothetical protein